ncbi:MAG TPA: hypothetical protein VGR00_15235 [Thermoanaerobaculia bacterium]|nr:hypothetical protein [Thermoanaerobaculia bacterium]
MRNGREVLRRLAIAAAIAFPRLVLAQSVLVAGPEFRVNTFTTNAQADVSVASGAGGAFVVVWQSKSQDSSDFGIFGQRYDAAGAPAGGEFPINTTTANAQNLSAVAVDSSGNFVVVWASAGQDGSGYGIFGRRFSSTGAPAGGEFRVNSSTTSAQWYPAISFSSSGSFLVVWQSFVPAGMFGGFHDVIGQVYSSAGTPVGGSFRVNTYTSNDQTAPAVAAFGSGFVVVWQSDGQDGYTMGVFGQRVDGTGASLGAEFRVNGYTTFDQNLPTVASDSSGRFVVAWHGGGDRDGSYAAVFAQRFDSGGAPSGGEFRVNSFTTGSQAYASISSSAAGGFEVVWRGTNQDGDGYGVFGQRFASSGAALGAEFRVSTFTTGYQTYPSIASDAAGDFVVAWQSDAQDGDAGGVFAQRFCVALAGVSIGSMGTTTTCTTGTGSMLTVTDVGGGDNRHQWGYRLVSMSGGITSLVGQTGPTYTIHGSDFPGAGTYYVVCTTMPGCGSNTVSNEITVTITSDGTPPTVSAPAASTAVQSLCQ